MKETTLLKIALVCSLVGLLVLYFISVKIEAKDYAPANLQRNAGEIIKLKGTVAKITDKGNVILIEVEQRIPNTVVLFTEENLKLENGDNVEVIGEVQKYNGKSEIIAQKIRVIG